MPQLNTSMFVSFVLFLLLFFFFYQNFIVVLPLNFSVLTLVLNFFKNIIICFNYFTKNISNRITFACNLKRILL